VSKPITMLLVDDHEMFREGLMRTFADPDFKIIGSAANVADGIAQLEQNPEVVLLDVDLGSERALDFLRASSATKFQGKILIVTAGISGQEAVQLIEAGVVGILRKHHSSEVLRDTIRKAMAGVSCLESEYLNELYRPMATPKRPSFTERDRAILRLVLQGLSNREIGEHLQITEGSVKASLHVLFVKLGVQTRSQLVKIALQQYKHEI
jgi:two-component system nitrate/nitrite response regulator NarL